MRGILATGTVVLVILGIGNHLWWLAAVALLYLYATHGRGSPRPTSPGTLPDNYRAYRDRRDRQARWERRYRRERPFEARRQEREKTS
ncbi:hypothetical protein ABZ595_10165 [Streptomyces rubradiris]|uniref:hypothetical protein n=1 Tax=Streptomyces rubradiris TaxID=285531 RepID=UPI0033D736FA